MRLDSILQRQGNRSSGATTLDQITGQAVGGACRWRARLTRGWTASRSTFPPRQKQPQRPQQGASDLAPDTSPSPPGNLPQERPEAPARTQPPTNHTQPPNQTTKPVPPTCGRGAAPPSQPASCWPGPCRLCQPACCLPFRLWAPLRPCRRKQLLLPWACWRWLGRGRQRCGRKRGTLSLAGRAATALRRCRCSPCCARPGWKSGPWQALGAAPARAAAAGPRPAAGCCCASGPQLQAASPGRWACRLPPPFRRRRRRPAAPEPDAPAAAAQAPRCQSRPAQTRRRAPPLGKPCM